MSLPKRIITSIITPDLLANLKKSNAPTPRSLFSFISGIMSNDNWRSKIDWETITHLSDPEKVAKLASYGARNIERWEKEKSPLPTNVEVTNRDWGVAAADGTRKYGVHALLNLANSKFPGGGFFKRGEGNTAVEENQVRRTTLASALLSEGIYYDEELASFVYTEEMSRQISAQKGLTAAELAILSKTRGEEITSAYSVFFNKNPQFCWRGPALLFDVGAVTERDQIGADNKVTQREYSYLPLPKDQIFPFYELRSAAPQLTGAENWEDATFVKLYEANVRQRIAAQLDTLILHGFPRVILGAWGCGAFKNSPRLIARIYREEIEKRANLFEHIDFPIISVRAKEDVTYSIFAEELHGLKLGKDTVVKDAAVKDVSDARVSFFEKEVEPLARPKVDELDKSKTPLI